MPNNGSENTKIAKNDKSFCIISSNKGSIIGNFCRFQLTVTWVKKESIKIYKDAEIFKKLILWQIDYIKINYWTFQKSKYAFMLVTLVTNIQDEVMACFEIKEGFRVRVRATPKRNNSVFKYMNI